MKKTLLLLFLILSLFSAFPQDAGDFFTSANTFFQQYTQKGLVKYDDLKQDSTDLPMLITMLGNTDINTLNGSKQKAFLINAYNLLVIKSIMDNYPVNSVQDVNGFFDQKKYRIGNESLTLNELETLMREKFRDARIHFTLVCGARGCPPLLNGAYTSDMLFFQLEKQAKAVINSKKLIQIDIERRAVQISEIFKWYKDDFLENHENLLSYINMYRRNKIPSDYEINYLPYDWALNRFITKEEKQKIQDSTGVNIQNYTPSVLLKEGQSEVKWFNNLYTQTQGFDMIGKTVNYGSRGSYFTSVFQFMTGVSTKLNIGAEVWLKSVRNDEIGSSAFKLLKFESDSNSRTAISYFGPKVRFTPVKKLQRFSVQSTWLFPYEQDQEGTKAKPYLSEDRHIWITEFFYDKPLTEKIQLFSRLSTWVYFDKKFERQTYISSPASMFLSWFPNKIFTIYGMVEFWPTYGNNLFSSYFLQSGVGGKYQVIKGVLELEILYTDFLVGKNSGNGKTFNLGVRMLR
ncbi:MAG: hypothetical protein COA57_10265 [Flavobacteriales bacterium]|nr:MAG: hypothetical protein COA57_10265 [Flavobacteriales bacterium]